jgi:dipeptidyl aminopeptidase/acylaminoacyl peptidase
VLLHRFLSRAAAAILVFAAIGVTTGAVPGAALAQTAPPPASLFHRPPEIAHVALAPDGRHLAMVTSRNAKRLRLVTVNLEAAAPPVTVASFGNADVVGFRWLDAQTLLLWTNDLKSTGVSYFGRAAYLVRADGTRFAEWGFEGWPVASPTDAGGRVLTMHRLRDVHGDTTGVFPRLLDVNTKAEQPLARGLPERTLDLLIDARGEPRLAYTARDATAAYHWRAPGSEAWQPVATFPLLDPPWQPLHVDDTGRVWVTTREGADGHAAITTLDAATGALRRPVIIATPGFDRSAAVIAEGPGRRVLGLRLELEGAATVWFDTRLKAVQADADRRFPERSNRLWCARCEAADGPVLLHTESDRDPGRWLLWRPATQRWEALGESRPDVLPEAMATVALERIRARDGREVPVWVTLPRGHAGNVQAGRKPSAVVLVHGGPWARGTFWQWNGLAQFFASRGHVVIEPEFRGSTGYGDAHFRAGWKQWGRAMQDDVADATLWAVKQGLVDGSRVCLAGASYGGYATLMGLARHGELYRCGIAWVAVTEPRLLFDVWRHNDYSEEWTRALLPQMLGDPKADAASFEAISPLAQAARIRAPLLLAMGLEDQRVPIEHGTRLRSSMAAAGNEPEWVAYAAEGHGFQSPDTWEDFAARIDRFLARHLAAPTGRR